MIAPSEPLLLWCAALACAVMALRARRPADSRAPDAQQRVPTVLRWAMRVPAPMGLHRRAVRRGDVRLVAAAGLDGHVSAADMAAARVGCATVVGLVAAPVVVAWPVAVVPIAAAVGLSAVAPGRWLTARAAHRRAAMLRELPDLMDLLGICVEAGMALDPALALSGERLGGTVGEEVGRLLKDLGFGMPRAAAYRALVERMDVPELTQVVAALLQADELGTPLSGALAGQAAALRSARRQAARDRAAKAAPKIQLVVALLMVPAVLILVLGVLIIELSRQVGAVVGP
jgi:tight adherence protein C